MKKSFILILSLSIFAFMFANTNVFADDSCTLVKVELDGLIVHPATYGNKPEYASIKNGKLTDDISGDKASIHDKYLIVENGAETSIYDYNLKLIRKSKYKVVSSGDGYILEQNPSDKNKYYLYTEWKDEPMIFDDIVWHILDGGYIHTSYALYNKYGERVLKSETKTISHVKDLGGGKHIFRTNDAIELLIYLPPYE